MTPGSIVKKIIDYVDYDIKMEDPYKCLIRTIISQRVRDQITDIVTEEFFNRFKSMEDVDSATEEQVSDAIKKAGMRNQKAKRIKQATKILLNKFNGKVPDSLKELLSLPGVGRKTANIVLSYAYGKDTIAVDTHVHRISNRLGIVNTKEPDDTEFALMKIIPKKLWNPLNISFVEYGKAICRPINPKCDQCVVNKYCKYYREKSNES
jgi:endonuclease-3